MSKKNTVADVKHPFYRERYRDWVKWRDTYEGGQRFINRYLRKFSNRETKEAYERRKELTYNPAFAKGAVVEIKNSIFSRLVDTARIGGSESYQKAIKGVEGGVDNLGSSMDNFIGSQILPELLPMARVGVYVDMPAIEPGSTMLDTQGKRPYVYIYRVEDIRSWECDESMSDSEYTNVLLQDYIETYDEETGLPTGFENCMRHVWKDKDGKVWCQYYTSSGDLNGEPHLLQISKVPFYVADIRESLLADVANYQIALLNLASSDMAYALSANFPFYTEQFEPRGFNEFERVAGHTEGGEAADGEAAKQAQINLGPAQGRRYPKGMERPGFIHPSSEPLTASIAKQNQMKEEIRQLVQLSVSSMSPTRASAESKSFDRQGLESGLAYIGLVLEHLERKIAEFWGLYESHEPANVYYPDTYAVKTADEKREEAKELIKLLPTIPSNTYRKALSRRIVELTVGRNATADEVRKMFQELEKADGLSAELEVLRTHTEIGILNLELASKLAGYPEGTVEKAAEDHMARVERIAAQTPKTESDPAARGVPELSDDPSGAGSKEKKESVDTTLDPEVKDKQRGEGK